MKCVDVDLANLDLEDKSGYKSIQMAKHLDRCSACQERFDQHVARDAETHELTAALNDTKLLDIHCEVDAAASEVFYQGAAVRFICSTDHVKESVTDSRTDSSAGGTRQSSGEDSTHAGGDETLWLREAAELGLLDSPQHPELLGRIGRYDLESIIGAGGMGIVFRAHDSDLNRVVALKVMVRRLAHHTAARQRFAREARAAAAVLHPNVLPIYDVDIAGQVPFIVTQYVPGMSLQRRVERDGTLDVVTALRIAKQTAEALSAAHRQGLIHRDVKPANILLEENTDRAVLGDFGLARVSDEASLTQTGTITGTPHYMSPEQARGEAITHGSDLFSLGSVLYFMLSGQPPFRAESALGVLHQVCHRKPAALAELNHQVPREVNHLVTKLLAKTAAHRPISAKQVAEKLDRLLAGYHRGELRLDSARRVTTKRVGGWLGATVAVAATLILLLNPSGNGPPEAVRPGLTNPVPYRAGDDVDTSNQTMQQRERASQQNAAVRAAAKALQDHRSSLARIDQELAELDESITKFESRSRAKRQVDASALDSNKPVSDRKRDW